MDRRVRENPGYKGHERRDGNGDPQHRADRIQDREVA
jgi:hypothetical protein